METRQVVVTTEYRGVFFGTVDSENDRTIVLTNARNCVSWSASVRGIFGLAAAGPDGNCRIGPAVPRITLVGVTSVTDCTDSAVKAWEAGPWSS